MHKMSNISAVNGDGSNKDAAVDFVVCARNNRDVIAPTFEALARQSVKPSSVTLVDGCSSDGTADFVRESFPWVEVVVKPSDTGPAASRNLGAFRGRAPFIVFVDSDVRLDPDWTREQMDFLRSEPELGAAAGKLLYADRPDILNSAYGTMTRYTVAANIGDGEHTSVYDKPVRCLWVLSAAFIVRRDVFESSGGFDEVLFMAHEDSDLGWRINLMGYGVSYNPRALALHEAHSTVNSATQRSGHMTYLLYRNRLRSALINYETKNILRYVCSYLCFCVADLVIRPYRWPKLRGLFWNVAHARETWMRRRVVQKTRRVSDQSLWKLFVAGVRGPGRTIY
jgi:GT2 family glycosyltransferase